MNNEERDDNWFISTMLGAFLLLMLTMLLFGCGESQEEQWIRETEQQIKANNEAYELDSIKMAQVDKLMRAGFSRIEAEKQVDEIYNKH